MNNLVEVVKVECSGCGLISNYIPDWVSIYIEEFGYWYYLCPECAKD